MISLLSRPTDTEKQALDSIAPPGSKLAEAFALLDKGPAAFAELQAFTTRNRKAVNVECDEAFERITVASRRKSPPVDREDLKATLYEWVHDALTGFDPGSEMDASERARYSALKAMQEELRIGKVSDSRLAEMRAFFKS